MKISALIFTASVIIASPVAAQEREDYSESYSRVKGAAVFDEKMGVDGTSISEEYELTHITCSDGSKNLRVLLPLAPIVDGTVFYMGGEKSILKKMGAGYTATFVANGKKIPKDMALKPVKDPKSLYHEQFEITLTVGDELWKAMRDKTPDQARALIGTGGVPVELPNSPKFTDFLKSCGIADK